ncbi:unnamed protein product [Arctogadus glacialis]
MLLLRSPNITPALLWMVLLGIGVSGEGQEAYPCGAVMIYPPVFLCRRVNVFIFSPNWSLKKRRRVLIKAPSSSGIFSAVEDSHLPIY